MAKKQKASAAPVKESEVATAAVKAAKVKKTSKKKVATAAVKAAKGSGDYSIAIRYNGIEKTTKTHSVKDAMLSLVDELGTIKTVFEIEVGHASTERTFVLRLAPFKARVLIANDTSAIFFEKRVNSALGLSNVA